MSTAPTEYAGSPGAVSLAVGESGLQGELSAGWPQGPAAPRGAALDAALAGVESAAARAALLELRGLLAEEAQQRALSIGRLEREVERLRAVHEETRGSTPGAAGALLSQWAGQELTRLGAAQEKLGHTVESFREFATEEMAQQARSSHGWRATLERFGLLDDRVSQLDERASAHARHCAELARRVEELAQSCGEASAAARAVGPEAEQRLSRLDAAVAGLGNELASDRVRMEAQAQAQATGLRDVLGRWEQRINSFGAMVEENRESSKATEQERRSAESLLLHLLQDLGSVVAPLAALPAHAAQPPGISPAAAPHAGYQSPHVVPSRAGQLPPGAAPLGLADRWATSPGFLERSAAAMGYRAAAPAPGQAPLGLADHGLASPSSLERSTAPMGWQAAAPGGHASPAGVLQAPPGSADRWAASPGFLERSAASAERQAAALGGHASPAGPLHAPGQAPLGLAERGPAPLGPPEWSLHAWPQPPSSPGCPGRPPAVGHWAAAPGGHAPPAGPALPPPAPRGLLADHGPAAPGCLERAPASSGHPEWSLHARRASEERSWGDGGLGGSTSAPGGCPGPAWEGPLSLGCPGLGR